MQEAVVTCATENGPVARRAWDLDVPGLVIAQEATNGAPFWTVTHVGSGWSVGHGYTGPEAAVEALWAVAPLADWTADAEDLTSRPELHRAVTEATDKADVWLPSYPYTETLAAP